MVLNLVGYYDPDSPVSSSYWLAGSCLPAAALCWLCAQAAVPAARPAGHPVYWIWLGRREPGAGRLIQLGAGRAAIPIYIPTRV